MQPAKSYVPFAYTISYTSIVDAVFAKWMENHNPDFVFEDGTGFYVYNGKRLTATRLYRELWPLVTSAVFEVWDWVRTTHPERVTQYLFVVNPCFKLNQETGMEERWKFGEEHDVKLNFPMFQEIFQKIFDKLFKLQVKNENSNILYLQADNVTYVQMLKCVVAEVFGNRQMMDLSTVFVPTHLTDYNNEEEPNGNGSTSTVLQWVRQTTGLSSAVQM